jgi:hypothetical protein
MHPIERSLVQKFKGKPFAVLGVKVDGSLEALRSSEKLHNLPWRSVWDGDKHTNLMTYGVSVTPTLFLIDHRGRRASQRLEGAKDEKTLEKAIRQLVDEAEQDAGQVAAE